MKFLLYYDILIKPIDLTWSRPSIAPACNLLTLKASLFRWQLSSVFITQEVWCSWQDTFNCQFANFISYSMVKVEKTKLENFKVFFSYMQFFYERLSPLWQLSILFSM